MSLSQVLDNQDRKKYLLDLGLNIIYPFQRIEDKIVPFCFFPEAYMLGKIKINQDIFLVGKEEKKKHSNLKVMFVFGHLLLFGYNVISISKIFPLKKRHCFSR